MRGAGIEVLWSDGASWLKTRDLILYLSALIGFGLFVAFNSCQENERQSQSKALEHYKLGDDD